MQMIWKSAGAIGLALLSGCSSASTGVSLPEGVDVTTPDFETYKRDDTGFSRVRRDYTTAADAATIAGFEDANPSDPAGYRNLIALSDAAYAGSMTIEVLAQVEGPDGAEQVSRVLRLTADQNPFTNEKDGALIASTGKYYLRGQNFVWASVNGKPIVSGSDSNGLVNLVLDFDAQTADLSLRTGVTDTSGIRTEIYALGLPFNIRTGAYGGDISVGVWDPDSTTIFQIDGSLRGNIGGTPAYENDLHGMTTSGIYTAEGGLGGETVILDGVFVGTDPNALP